MIKEEKREIVQKVFREVMDEFKRQPGFRDWLYGTEFDAISRNNFLTSLKRKISKEIPRATKQ